MESLKIYSLSDRQWHSTKEEVKEPSIKRCQLLQLQGYNNPKYLVTKVDEQFVYSVSLDSYLPIKHSINTIIPLSQKISDCIQLYSLDQFVSESLTTKLENFSNLKQENLDRLKNQHELEREEKIKRGKELWSQYCPENAIAVVVVSEEIDESDSMSDYFNQRREQEIILGFSLTTRENFAEMRKHCHKLEKTKIFCDKNPSHEHRENYSMGKGTYLKEKSYGSGVVVYKERKGYQDWSDKMYISLCDHHDHLERI